MLLMAVQQPILVTVLCCDGCSQDRRDHVAQLAAKSGRLQVLRWLVDDLGVPLDAVRAAAFSTNRHCFPGLLCCCHCVCVVFAGGAWVQYGSGPPLLHAACEAPPPADNTAVIEWLLKEKGASVEVLYYESTPLMSAAAAKNLTTLSLLVEKFGADVNAATAVSVACKHLCAAACVCWRRRHAGVCTCCCFPCDCSGVTL